MLVVFTATMAAVRAPRAVIDMMPQPCFGDRRLGASTTKTALAPHVPEAYLEGVNAARAN